MKILIAGCGKVGATLTKLLTSEGHEITLIDRNPEILESIMERYDVIGVQGNAATMESLEQAGVEDADLLIAATDMDEVNLLSCLTAHGLNEKLHTIGILPFAIISCFFARKWSTTVDFGARLC